MPQTTKKAMKITRQIMSVHDRFLTGPRLTMPDSASEKGRKIKIDQQSLCKIIKNTRSSFHHTHQTGLCWIAQRKWRGRKTHCNRHTFLSFLMGFLFRMFALTNFWHWSGCFVVQLYSYRIQSDHQQARPRLQLSAALSRWQWLIWTTKLSPSFYLKIPNTTLYG